MICHQGYDKQPSMVDVAANYRRIVQEVEEAAAKAGRGPARVRILAAAKSQSVEAIRAAIAAGISLVGENYVQEAEAAKRAVSSMAEWHMIGHLQRNKCKAAVALFDLIESLDSIALARELAKEGRKAAKQVRAFVEINLGSEQSKTGVAKGQLPALLEQAATLTHLRIEGLMTVPPLGNPEDARPYFRELKETLDHARELRLPNVELKELSMGMSQDYTVAIEEGATIVRIGTALFGPRKA
jgi:pyridoxal phosphate enzyme (YggS family)